MNRTLLPIRIVFILLCAAAGWLICYTIEDWDRHRLLATFIGGSLGTHEPDSQVTSPLQKMPSSMQSSSTMHSIPASPPLGIRPPPAHAPSTPKRTKLSLRIKSPNPETKNTRKKVSAPGAEPSKSARSCVRRFAPPVPANLAG